MAKREKKPREYKGVRDEIREQQLKAKDMTFKEKLGYFWYYYKIHTIVALLVILAGSTFIHEMVTAKDFCFYGIMLNSSLLDGEAMNASFSEYAQLDSENYECFIDTDSTLSYEAPTQFDMATMQKLIALVQTKDLDAVVFDSQVYNNYATNEMFMDLRTILTQEEIAVYEDYFYYIDYEEIAAAEENIDYENSALISSEESSGYTMEDIYAEADIHRHPENMEAPMPVGIFMGDSPFAQKTGAYPYHIPVFGISITTQRPETAKAYLTFLWDDSVDFVNMLAAYEY